MDYAAYFSAAARRFQESAIRRAGALAGRVPDLISFAAGSPSPDVFPWEAMSDISAELLARRDGSVLQYGATRGYRPLVESIAAQMHRRSIPAAIDSIVVTTGSQQGIDLVGRVLVDPGDTVLVERPAYSGAIAAFQNLQTRLVGVPHDAEGLDVEALSDVVESVAAQGSRPRLLYVTPNFQNPAGLLMTPARRLALLEAAARHNLLIVEDDPYGTLAFDEEAAAVAMRPIKADDRDGRVVYLGTLSKMLVPGLRVGWMVAPPAVAERVELAKQATDLCSGMFDQRIAHLAFARGVVDALAPRLCTHYREKREAMEAALRACLRDRVRWRQPRGGFFIWLEILGAPDDRALFERALAERVSFVVGSAFFVDGGGHDRARLSFSNAAPERIAEGIARLARAFGPPN